MWQFIRKLFAYQPPRFAQAASLTSYDMTSLGDKLFQIACEEEEAVWNSSAQSEGIPAATWLTAARRVEMKWDRILESMSVTAGIEFNVKDAIWLDTYLTDKSVCWFIGDYVLEHATVQNIVRRGS